MWTELAALRDALADIEGVKTCKVGIESGMSPADYPMIRVVPIRITPGKPYNHRTAEVRIYFGMDLGETEGDGTNCGLEYVYRSLDTLEGSIITTIKAEGGRYIDTVTDEDRLDTFKVMVVRCEITCDRPTP